MEAIIDWKTHVDNWKKSGLAQTEYCRRENLKKNTFYYHLRQDRQRKSFEKSDLVEIPFQQNFSLPEESPILEFRIDRMFRLRFRLDFRISLRKSS